MLTDAPTPRIILDLDKPGSPLPRDAQRCDYLMVSEGKGGNAPDCVAVLELKAGRLHAGQVIRQLQAGARVAEGLIPDGDTVAFRPIAASRRTSKYERSELRKASPIRFHRHRERVRLMECGARLTTVLN